jgi:hypothetical protein
MRSEGEHFDYLNPAAAIPYDAHKPDSTSYVAVVTGSPGETVRQYFVLRAFYDGEESGDSNEVYKDFVIPHVPHSLRINVIIQSVD